MIDVEPPVVEKTPEEESDLIKPENTERQEETPAKAAVIEQPSLDEMSATREEEEVTAPETEEPVESDTPEQNDDNEFVVVSQDDAPIELAEEYHPTEVFRKIVVLRLD